MEEIGFRHQDCVCRFTLGILFWGQCELLLHRASEFDKRFCLLNAFQLLLSVVMNLDMLL